MLLAGNVSELFNPTCSDISIFTQHRLTQAQMFCFRWNRAENISVPQPYMFWYNPEICWKCFNAFSPKMFWYEHFHRTQAENISAPSSKVFDIVPHRLNILLQCFNPSFKQYLSTGLDIAFCLLIWQYLNTSASILLLNKYCIAPTGVSGTQTDFLIMVNMFQDSRCSVTDMLQTQVFTYVESVSAPPKSLSIHFDNSRYSVIDVFQAQIPMLKAFQLHPFHSCRCLDMLQTQAPYVEVAPPKHFNIIKTS